MKPLEFRQPVFAGVRPSPIAAPIRQDVAALAKPDVFGRWKAGVRASGDIGANVITMYDVIGEDFWSGGGVTVSRVDAALRKIGNQAVEIHINSPGGDVFEGVAIYNRLLEHPAPVTMKVMGLAASAASLIAMAGSEILIGPASFLMIHNCWVMAMGDSNELRGVADWLEPFDAAAYSVYADRTGQTVKDIKAWCDAETWMNGSQAVDRGFATGLLKASDMQEDEMITQQSASMNALRQTEIGLCKSMSRSDARSLLKKIKGTPGAASEPAKPGAGDRAWLDAAVGLTQLINS